MNNIATLTFSRNLSKQYIDLPKCTYIHVYLHIFVTTCDTTYTLMTSNFKVDVEPFSCGTEKVMGISHWAPVSPRFPPRNSTVFVRGLFPGTMMGY